MEENTKAGMIGKLSSKTICWTLSHEAKHLILFVTRLPVIFKPQTNITFQKRGEDAIKGACIL